VLCDALTLRALELEKSNHSTVYHCADQFAVGSPFLRGDGAHQPAAMVRFGQRLSMSIPERTVPQHPAQFSPQAPVCEITLQPNEIWRVAEQVPQVKQQLTLIGY